MITLATLPRATKQQVFNQVVSHARKQREHCTVGARGGSVNPSSCNYRLKGTRLMCFGGCLISNKEYDDAFEASNWDTLVNEGSIPPAHCHFIRELQMIHDAHFVDDWDYQFNEFAEKHSLKYTSRQIKPKKEPKQLNGRK